MSRYGSFDQSEVALPRDISLLYLVCNDFNSELANRERILKEGRTRQLVVIDMRNNGGGFP